MPEYLDPKAASIQPSFPLQVSPNEVTALSLRANFSWTFVGNVVYAGCQWGMLVVLAKLGSPETVGLFALGLAVTAPVIQFVNLQLRGAQVTDAAHEYQFGDYLGLRLTTTTLALLIIAGIVSVSRYQLDAALVIMLIGIAKAIESISDVYYGMFQQHECMEYIATSMMIKGLLSLLLLGLGFYLSNSLFWGLLGIIVSWSVILLTYDIPKGVHIAALHSQTAAMRPRWSVQTLLRLAWTVLPLGMVMLLISLNTNIPRYVIEQHYGVRHLGIFAALSYLIVAGTTVVSALGQSASPRLAKYYAAGNSTGFQHLLLTLVGIGLLLGGAGTLVAWVAGQEILTLLYQPEYATYTNVFVLLTISAGLGFVASFLGCGMTAARYFRAQFPLFLLVTGTVAVACFLIIPSQGLYGAAVALIIANTVQIISSMAVIAHALRRLQGRAGRS